MELHPEQRISPVLEAHNDIPVTKGVHHKILLARSGLYHQGVIPGHGKRVWYPLKKSFALMDHGACLSMHRNRSPGGDSAKGFVDTLHAQTDPKNRYFRIKGLDYRNGYSGMAWIFRARADQNVIGINDSSLPDRQLITSEDLDGQVVLPEHLNQIERKGIVIIYDKKGCHRVYYLHKKKKRHPGRAWVAFAYYITQESITTEALPPVLLKFAVIYPNPRNMSSLNQNYKNILLITDGFMGG